MISLYSTAFDVDSPILYQFVEFRWVRSATIYEICVLKDISFKYSWISAPAITFHMLVEKVLVFFESELIVTLDVTIFGSF